MSNSQEYKRKKAELEAKEKLLLKGLSERGGGWKRVGIWALGVGVLSLLGWGIYTELFPSKKKRKKGRKKPPENSPMLDSFIEQTAPKIGKWLLKEFKD